MEQANVIDVKWILSEETGKLRYESLRTVKRNPRHQILVEVAEGSCSAELIERYHRIVEDRKARGIRNG